MNPLRGTERNLKRIITRAKEVGPRNAALIARHTGIPPTTVRYSIRNLLKRRGIEFHGDINYALLGLRRYLLTLRFGPSPPRDPEKILERMARKAFLEWYGKIIPSADYSALAAVPLEFQGQFREFLKGLVESGLLRDYQSHGMDWFRLRSLDEADYSFRRRRWEVDWKRLDGREVHVEKVPAAAEGAFRSDRVDLLILKELQLDATIRLSRMARKLKHKYKTIYYHFNEHVVDRGLIRRYAVYPKVPPGDGGAVVIHVLKGLSSSELVEAENLFHRVPFTWMDGYGREKGLYVALTALPGAQLTDMFEYISEGIPAFREKHSFKVLSLAHTKSFTVPYQMMTKEGAWRFEPQQALREVTA
ncbi:MAG: hypothetical protein ACE5KH_04575 [Candidatus Geothermarchaeales archaeon]